jgi:phosphate:Na+ symporter
MVELIALYLAGLSFFFSGVAGISDNLRQLSGQRFRQLLARATQHPLIAGLLGATMGAVTQSSSVVAFILAGMTATGLLSMERALLVLACSNIGTAVLVFIAALDLHLPILFLIGMSGLILAFKMFNKFKPGFAALLSIGLVFFGLDMMKQVFKPLASAPGFAGIGRFFDFWPDAAFFLGMLLRTVIHSSSAVAAITITINKGGMLGEFPAMMSMAGLGAGTAVATYMLSSNLRGVPRQIALYQMLGNVGASVLLAALLMIERYSGIPLLLALTHRLSPSIAGRMAYMYFAFNVAIVVVSVANLRWLPAWLVKICPPTLEQDLSRPMYLQVETLNSPETALDLAALEQMRLVRVFQKYMEAARGDKTIPLKSLHGAAGELSQKITEFLEALVQLPIATDLAARVISFQRKEETLRALEENAFLFSETLQDQTTRSEMAGRLVEALDTLVLTAMDALQTKDETDVNMLVQLTEDRGGMMERLRDRLRLSEGQNVGNIAAQHYATTLFERNVWLLRQLALWLREDARTGGV